MSTDLTWIANYIWGIADDVLRDLYVREAAAALPEVDLLAVEDTLNDTLDTGAV